MEEVVADLPPSIRIITPDYYSHTPLSELSQVMKGLTSTCDLVVSSRYHGVIFALSESVPTLAIVGNTYQHMKNSEALKFVFGSKWKQYLIDLRDQAAVSDALSAWTEILANKSAISKHVRSKNIKLHNEYDTYLATLKSVIVGDRQLLS